ncbi:MAG: cobalamin-5-phosphate synthase CobS [Frankiales bacterium]|nr:cobalamin-5-phosphate synthase CobS [Frankiales bacterium]
MSLAVSMFSVLPVPHRFQSGERLDRKRAGQVLLWLPALGALLGAVAGLAAVAVLERDKAASLLAAAVGVLLLAALAGGLHLDGLADTADGLASRAPREQALEIMRRSDIGPFGVLAIAGLLLLDTAALSEIGAAGHPWRVLAALVVAATTGRVAATQAGLTRVPAARSGGFGALVTGSVRVGPVLALTALTLAGGGLLAWSSEASLPGWLITQVAALTLGYLGRRQISARLGGMTGDVFGAVIETTTALTLLGMALAR